MEAPGGGRKMDLNSIIGLVSFFYEVCVMKWTAFGCFLKLTELHCCCRCRCSATMISLGCKRVWWEGEIHVAV